MDVRPFDAHLLDSGNGVGAPVGFVEADTECRRRIAHLMSWAFVDCPEDQAAGVAAVLRWLDPGWTAPAAGDAPVD